MSLAKEKWVRVMTDYSSDGLWNKVGAAVGAEDLPVSATLKARIAAWCDSYETSEFYMPAERRERPFDLAVHSAEGLAIARAIKEELPTWSVVYFDAAKAEASNRDDGDRSGFEYEIRLTAA